MADENELINLREELKQIQEGMRRTRKRAAFGFGVLILALILSFLYAFVQQVAATKNAEEANRQHQLAESARREANQNAEEAQRQAAIASAQRAAAEKMMEETRAALAKCKGKK